MHEPDAVSDTLRRVTPVVRLAPAKLNLTLAIVGRREDGFHALHSVMVPLEIADRLALAPAFASGDTLHVTGAMAVDIGPPDRNLVLRAIAATRAACRARGVDAALPALAARLEKRIPIAAGLGGGSSDAAAAVDAALDAWGVGEAIAPADRASIASGLGSDVPFFLAGGWTLVEGRGERVTSLPTPRGPAPAVLLVTPGLGVSTAAVFAAFADGARPGPGAALASSRHLAGELVAGMTAARFVERAGIMAVANDLAAATAAVAPALVAFRRALGRLVGRPVGQSGSGPTLWVLYPSLAAAEAAAVDVRAALAAGDLPASGERPPFVCATRIIVGDPGSSFEAGLDRPAKPIHDGGS
jgi:4-diphosphocytidyl-2-C-methyl-D-erythritol kinase